MTAELQTIEALEARLSGAFPHTRHEGSLLTGQRQAAVAWSDAVWATAVSDGPLSLDSETIARGIEVGRRPVFVVGVHRSGTTLVRDLLDWHPALSILPSEGTYFDQTEPQLRRAPRSEWVKVVGCEWLRRVANPNNQSPYFVLGRTTAGHSPYTTFARALQSWWPVVAEHFEQITPAWPLVAVGVSYAFHTGRLSTTLPLRWGEKTPAGERHIDRLQREFPEARWIQVLRHPGAVFASRKTLEQRSLGSFRSRGAALRDLVMSYRTAADQLRKDRPDRFFLLRYEALIENTAAVTTSIADFLGIEPLPILRQPTVAGLPSRRNSSFATEVTPGIVHRDSGGSWTNVLTPMERDLLTARVGDAARGLGYDLEPASRWRSSVLRALSWFT
jgi:hypothetical protein